MERNINTAVQEAQMLLDALKSIQELGEEDHAWSLIEKISRKLQTYNDALRNPVYDFSSLSAL